MNPTSISLLIRIRAEDFPGVVQKMMEWSIVPRDPMFGGQCFELLQVFFRNPLTRFLVRRIAVVDTAPQGPRLAGGAEVVLLERAEVRRHGPLIRRGAGQKNFRLQVADEQDVAILLETAATAAGDADRTGSGDGAIDLGVKVQYLTADLFGHARFLQANDTDATRNFLCGNEFSMS
jgi:hypothetical protein